MSDTLRQQIRQKLNLDPIPAILGDASGTVYEPGRNGYIRVRIREGGSSYGSYKVVRLRGVLQPLPGKPVLLYYDPDGELAVRETDFAGATAAGYNANYDNPADRSIYRFVRQSDLLTGMVAPTNPAGMKLLVSPFVYRKQRKVYTFGGSLTATFTAPSAGEHYAAVVALKADNTVEITYGTAQSVVEDLDGTDIQEALDGLTEGAIPLWAWRIYGGQTSIVLEDSIIDLRQFLDTDLSGVWTGAAAPGVGDDKLDGYGLGAIYVDTVTDKIYLCADNSTGAAVWKEVATGGGSGTVTSVALAAPSILTVSGSPVTTTGTLTLALATQSANTVFSGPTTGSPAAPTFRAIVADDVPNLSATKITSGTLGLARGGTGADLSATGGANQFVKQSSAGGAFTVAGILSADLTTALTTPPPIGGTTPSTAVFSTNVQITASAANARLDMFTYGAQNLYQGYAAGGTSASPTATTASQNMLNVTALGHDGSGFVTASPRMIFQAAELFSGSAQGTQIVFSTTRTGTTTRTDVLTIDNEGALTSVINDPATAANVDVWTVNLRSTGTAAASFGAGLLFNLESSTTNDRNAGRLKVDWQTATDASRAGRVTLSAWNVATERTIMQGQANSARAAIGFLGATPVEAPDWTAATGTATRATFATGTVTLVNLAQAVKAIIDDLLAFGLFR